MPQIIIHHEGVFNVYSTIVDAPLYNEGLDEETLREYIRAEYGNEGLRRLPRRIKRARQYGASSRETLAECVAFNRAGPDETELPLDKLIARFLTRKPEGGDHE